MPLYLPSSSVFVSLFILAIPMRKCLGKHLCMSFQFPIAIQPILNGTCFFSDSVTTNAHFEFGAKSRNSDVLVNLYFLN